MAADNSINKPNSVVITVPDPDGTVFYPVAEVGGTMEWRTESVNYPEFEVQFIGANPTDDTLNFVGKGSRHRPLVLKVNNPGTYTYEILHRNKNGLDNFKDSPAAGRVVPCPHCPPNI